jgi:hypothetical protein
LCYLLRVPPKPAACRNPPPPAGAAVKTADTQLQCCIIADRSATEHHTRQRAHNQTTGRHDTTVSSTPWRTDGERTRHGTNVHVMRLMRYFTHLFMCTHTKGDNRIAGDERRAQEVVMTSTRAEGACPSSTSITRGRVCISLMNYCVPPPPPPNNPPPVPNPPPPYPRPIPP